jgi:2OG-Fe(II) oxygenase superfamily
MILTNFVPTDYQDKLENLLLGTDIAWNYQPETVYAGEGNNLNSTDYVITNQTKESWQLVHVSAGSNGRIFSPFNKIFLPVLGMAGFGKPIVDRIKTNTLFKDTNFPKDFYNTPHIDHHDSQTKTLLYYVNDSDGDTIIFNERYQEINRPTDLTIKYRCTPRKGTALLFDSNLFHCGSPPLVTDRRVVINFIFNI